VALSEIHFYSKDAAESSEASYLQDKRKESSSM